MLSYPSLKNIATTGKNKQTNQHVLFHQAVQLKGVYRLEFDLNV